MQTRNMATIPIESVIRLQPKFESSDEEEYPNTPANNMNASRNAFLRSIMTENQKFVNKAKSHQDEEKNLTDDLKKLSLTDQSARKEKLNSKTSKSRNFSYRNLQTQQECLLIDLTQNERDSDKENSSKDLIKTKSKQTQFPIVDLTKSPQALSIIKPIQIDERRSNVKPRNVESIENKSRKIQPPIVDLTKSPQISVKTVKPVAQPSKINNASSFVSDPKFVAHFLTHTSKIQSNENHIPLPAEVWRQNNCLECTSKLNEMLENICGLSNFEKQINYKFKDKTLLLQALTHSSCLDNQFTENYENLEFNGDHQLNFLVTRQLERDNRSKTYTPGNMTQKRIILLRNSTLAWLAVEHNFHHYLRYSSHSLEKDIEKMIHAMNSKLKEMSNWNTMTKIERQRLVDYLSVKAPKALADVFEAVAAAVYFDCGEDLEILWSVYQPLMAKAFELL